MPLSLRRLPDFLPQAEIPFSSLNNHNSAYILQQSSYLSLVSEMDGWREGWIIRWVSGWIYG